jgi:phage terminase large subunit-like protein
MDGPECKQAFWRDGGQSGKVDEMHTTDLLRKKCPNISVIWEGETKSKEQYAKPFASYCDPAANSGLRMVSLLRAPWNAELLAELERFPRPKGAAGEGVHDDIVDALSRMWLELQKGKTGNAARFLQAMTAMKP